MQLGNNYEYSRGTRAEVINKFSEKGVVWKTYEGQITLEGIVSTGDSVGANVWNFSLDGNRAHGEKTEELAKKIQESLEAGKKVKVNYIQTVFSWPWRGSTDYFVQSVESVEKKENK